MNPEGNDQTSPKSRDTSPATPQNTPPAPSNPGNSNPQNPNQGGNQGGYSRDNQGNPRENQGGGQGGNQRDNQGQGGGQGGNQGNRQGGGGGGGGGGGFQNRQHNHGRHQHHRHQQRHGGGGGGGGGGNQGGGGGGNNQNRSNQQGGQGQHNRQNFGGGNQAPPPPQVELQLHDGWLEISEKGFGFLRSAKGHFAPKPTDVFLTPDSIKRLGLREGCHIKCTVNPPHRGNSPQLRDVLEVSGKSYQDYLHSMRFENLTTIDPIEKFSLETSPDIIETRVIDLVTPIGKGTRGLIVAPPRTGKTTILKQIANAVTANHPDVHVMVLLIDERPEEVTDFQRSVKAEVVASSNDQDLETHVRLSRFMIERCRRMVEAGKDVFVLLDSITRVARAYNSVHGGSGRTMTGGVDARALEAPRKMFAAARKIEEGGSLTILATALIDTGSRMDELIFQEFKGTGNMELILDRRLSDRRLFPAIDIPKSGTRKEEKLFPPKNLEAIRKLRRMMTDLQPIEAMETLTAALKKHKTNDELLAKLA